MQKGCGCSEGGSSAGGGGGVDGGNGYIWGGGNGWGGDNGLRDGIGGYGGDSGGIADGGDSGCNDPKFHIYLFMELLEFSTKYEILLTQKNLHPKVNFGFAIKLQT